MDALRYLFSKRQDLRLASAAELYQEGKVTLSRAAEMAGMVSEEFKDVLVEKGLKIRVLQFFASNAPAPPKQYDRRRASTNMHLSSTCDRERKKTSIVYIEISGGWPLIESNHAYFEPRFGVDFTQVQRTERLRSMNTPADRILFLQRTVGNQAVSRLMKSRALQAKLRIGKPGDMYEQEADRVVIVFMFRRKSEKC